MDKEIGQSDAVRRAQLQSAVSNLPVSLSANCFIAGSASLLVYQEQHDGHVFLWLLLAITHNIARIIHGTLLRRSAQTVASPERTLRTLAILAFIGGLVWVPLPTYFITSIETRTTAYVVFIMAGISTGAIIQSLPYWRISVAFGTPILTATILKLLLEGNGTDYVVAGNLLLLMAMLFRIAVISEGQFRRNCVTTIEATQLAASLQLANDEVHRANETLKRLATTDSLTGLPNRAVFNQTLANLIQTREPVALALIDIDHFKQINDSFGHAVGDEILSTVALFMMDEPSPQTTPIRLGGDEFAVIVSGAGCAERLSHYASRVRERIEGIRSHEGLPQVTISIGLCTDVKAVMSASDLFAEADRALYAAKAAGRNRIHEAGPASSRARSA